MPSRRFLLATFCCVMAGALIAQNWSKASAYPSTDLLPQPAGWVPFSADAELIQPGGQKYHGRFLRASDGSTRFTLTPDRSAVPHITIRNVTQVRYYIGANGQWITGPMDLPPGGYKPHKYRASMKGLSPYADKLALTKGGDRSLRAAKGLDAFRYVTRTGTVWLLAPALNYYPVLKVFLDGRRLEFSEIEIGEPDRSQFVPPAGAVLTLSDSVAGIGRVSGAGAPGARTLSTK